MKIVIITKFKVLSKEEQSLMSVLSVICTERVDAGVVRDIVAPDDHIAFITMIERLCAWNWLADDCKLFCPEYVAEAVQEIAPIDELTATKLLASLKTHIVLRPLDDMASKQQYFVVARLLLTHLLKRWNSLFKEVDDFLALFCDNVIALSRNIELSYYANNRKAVGRLEERIDYRLLSLVKNYVGGVGYYKKGLANRQLGILYTAIFRYEEAKECFRLAERYSFKDAKLMIAQAVMYEMLGVYGKAFQYAQRAYLQNEHDGSGDANIIVCLYLSYLCAICRSADSCKYWRKKARSLIAQRTIPANHLFAIILNEIEALLHLEDTALAMQILDKTELQTIRLYGVEAPEIGRIAFIRSLVDSETGLMRSSDRHYRRYVDVNHSNYGQSVADLAVLYSSIASTNVVIGNVNTANIFAMKMQALYAESDAFAPGVRMGQSFANCASCLADGDFEPSKAYLETAQKIYHNELKPDNETISEIKTIFCNGVIPEAVTAVSEYRAIQVASINICIEEGRTAEAKMIVKEMTEKEADSKERLAWDIHFGRCLVAEGKNEEGMRLWKDTIYSAPNEHRFQLAKLAAEWARHYGLTHEAISLYEDVLEAESMVYAQTCHIAVALQDYADALDYCGLKGKSDEPWKQALMLMQSMGDKDGISLLYFSWGVAKQDYEAEVLLNKAIDYWEPEQFAFDETLSKMYYFSCCSQAMQGKSEEARISAQKAVRLYPVNFPINLLEDIEAYL